MNNKRYYWIKLRTDFFSQDGAIDFLMSQKNGCEYVVLYQMLCLKTANTNGSLITKIGEMIVPYDVNKIVRDTKYFDFDTVTIALGLYKKLGLVYEEEDGNLKISNYDEMIGSEAANPHAQRQKRYRERKKIEQSVTKSDVTSDTNSDISSATQSATVSDDSSDVYSVTKNDEDIRDKILDIRDKDNRYKDSRKKEDWEWDWEWEESVDTLDYISLILSLKKKKLFLKSDDIKTYNELIKEYLDKYDYKTVAIEVEHLLRKMKENKIENRIAYFNSSLKNNFVEKDAEELIQHENIFNKVGDSNV